MNGFPAVGKNTKLGKGALFYALIDPDTEVVEENYHFAGNAPEVNLSWEVEEDELLSSTQGPAIVVDTIVNRATLTLSASLMEHRLQNLLRYLMADEATVNQAAAPTLVVNLNNVKLDSYYDLGKRALTSVVSVVKGSTPLVEDRDYSVDLVAGMLWVRPAGGGNIVVADDDLVVTINVPVKTITKAQIGQDTQRYVKLKYICNDSNQSGISSKDQYVFWKARIAPDGDMALISDSRATIPLRMTVTPDTVNHSSEPYGTMERVTA